MLSEQLRARLEQLNRQPLPPSSASALPPRPASACPAPSPSGEQSLHLVAGRAGADTARRSNAKAIDCWQQMPVDQLAQAAKLPAAAGHGWSEGHEVDTPWGSHWLIEQPLSVLWPTGERYIQRAIERAAAQVDHEPSPETTRRPQRALVELQAFQQAFPDRVVLLDIETCGFAGAMIFLVGILYQQDDEFVLGQLWARNYAEEKAMLQTLWHRLAGKQVLITFNGKSFDWPQILDRSTLHHLGQGADPSAAGDHGPETAAQQGSTACHPCLPTDVATAWTRQTRRPQLTHLDLLHHSRRRWRAQLPNCRLQTLERYICGRRRVEDIPSREIPQAYRHYVQTGQLDAVHSILHHNALDLITLLQLALLFTA